MGQIGVYLRRLFEWLCLWAGGHGIILLLATKGIYPDRVVFAMVTGMVSTPEWVAWLIPGGLGLLGVFMLEKFAWPNLKSRANSKIVSQNIKEGRARPDYTKWDAISDFTLGQVACLWIDREPLQHLGADEVAVFRKLEQYVSNRTLVVKRDDLREVIGDSFRKQEGHIVKASPKWRVERNDLLMLAVLVGEKPPFLYPKERIY